MTARTVRSILPPLAIIVGVLLLWETWVDAAQIKPFILPSPSRILQSLVGDHKLILGHLGITLAEILAGYIAAACIAFISGVAIAYSRILRRSVYPLIVLFHMVPVIAIAPILIIWFGYNVWPRIIVTALIAYFPMVVNVVAGFSSVEPELQAFFRSLNAGRIETFLKLALPTALPSIFAGLKITSVLAVVGATVSEWIGADRGLGHLIAEDTSQFYTERVFASITVLSLVGIALFALTSIVEWLVLPWQHAQRKTRLWARIVQAVRAA
jgi:ABC-type nitrate/sulfonate/bicarbonate transport system permease component